MAHTSIAGESPTVTAERALATERQSAAVRSGDAERINYGGRTVEVPKIDHAAIGRPVDKQYERNLETVKTRLNSIGVHAATIVSFLPFPLKSDSTIDTLRRLTVHPPKDSQDYVTYTIDEAWIEPSRMGADSPLMAFEFHPITLAQEFPRIRPRGVFCFIGLPEDLTREDWRNKKSPEAQHGGRTYGQVFDDTRASGIVDMQEQLRMGNEDSRQKKNPTERSKASARRLKVLGLIKEIPDWVEKQRDVTVKIPNCPNCQRPCEPGAAQCTNQNCNYIIDPEKAYSIGAISEDNLALERLTRKQVDEMGISDYVAETLEEKKKRLKVGGTKPLSLVAQRMQESNDEAAMQQTEHGARVLAKAINKPGGKNGKNEPEAETTEGK